MRDYVTWKCVVQCNVESVRERTIAICYLIVITVGVGVAVAVAASGFGENEAVLAAYI